MRPIPRTITEHPGVTLEAATLRERKEAADLLGLPPDHPFRGLVLAPLCNCTHFCGQAPVKEPYRCLHLPSDPED